MARAIKVDAAQLRNWASEIRGIAEEYSGNFNGIQSTADSLASSWMGEDNVAYQKKVHEFDDDFQKMHREILQYASYLEKTAKVYDVVRDVAQKKAGNLQGHYNGGGFSGGGGSSGGAGSSRSFAIGEGKTSSGGGGGAFGGGGGGGGVR